MWVNEDYETDFVYDAQQRLQSYILQEWDTTGWVNSEKYIFTYGAGEIPTGAILQQWNGSSFIDSSRIIDLQWIQWNGHPESSIPAFYVFQNYVGGNWINAERITFTYDNFGSQTVLTEYFSNGVWKNAIRLQQLIDEQFNPTFSGFEEFNDTLSRWDTTFGYWNVHTYDPDNRITETITRIFQEFSINPDDPPVMVWIDFQRKVYTSHVAINITKLAATKQEDYDSSIFPNPVSVGATYSISGPDGRYLLMDSQGRIIRSGMVISGQKLSADGLMPGIYQVQVEGIHGEKWRRRLIIQ
jgi:hypothetical protein